MNIDLEWDGFPIGEHPSIPQTVRAIDLTADRVKDLETQVETLTRMNARLVDRLAVWIGREAAER